MSNFFKNEKNEDVKEETPLQDLENLTSKEIDGIQFQIILMPALTAAVLDRRIIAVIAPAIGSMAKEGLDTEVGLEQLLNGLADGLSKLSNDEYLDLLKDLLLYVTAVTNQGAFSLDNNEAINKVFQKKIVTLYKVIIEVMKFNGFSVFGLVGVGKGTNLMDMLSTGTTGSKKTGK